MITRQEKKEREMTDRLREALPGPEEKTLSHSRAHIEGWFRSIAPTIRWGEMASPLGTIYIAMSAKGLYAVDFGRRESEFLGRFDPRAHLEKDPPAVKQAVEQLRQYFSGERKTFRLPVDLAALTPFQRDVLETACRIHPGQVWTYGKVAQEMGRPKSSRPVGQALAHNPVPIIIPCHRVIASDGTLGGYSGGSGLRAKRWLLRLEGAPL
jgi:methylated-DNA-[protein]-cysteine S-methyltransferase